MHCLQLDKQPIDRIPQSLATHHKLSKLNNWIKILFWPNLHCISPGLNINNRELSQAEAITDIIGSGCLGLARCGNLSDKIIICNLGNSDNRNRSIYYSGPLG